MQVLVWAGVVQGFSTPPLLLLIVLMTGDHRIMGDQVNGLPLSVLAWATTVFVFAISGGLVVSWFL
jgi:Mn2+/Fe2+ NRAMP family transporter